MIDLRRKSLMIYHRRSAKATAKLIKQSAYRIEERVKKLAPGLKPHRNRVSILQIM